MKKGDRTEMDMGKLSNAVEGKPVHYPSMVSLDEGDLMCIKDWKVGEEYEVKLKLKMVSSSMGMGPMNDSDKDKVHGKFEVVKAESLEDEDEKKENY